MSSHIPGLKATNINNKSTFVWLLHYTASRVHPVSTFPYLILKIRTTTTTLIKVKRNDSLLWREEWKQRGWKLLCVCLLVSPSWKLARPHWKACNMSVFGPSRRGCCVLLDGCEEQRWVLAVHGRQTEGWSLVCKVSLLTAGRNS